VHRLEEGKVIKISAAVDPARLGKETWFVVGILVERSCVYEVANALLEIEQVSFIAITLGMYDLIAVLGGERQELVELTDRIVTIPGVRRTETMDTRGTAKYDYLVAVLT
jgi:DNA-binding Lrp family transcriptional regulator